MENNKFCNIIGKILRVLFAIIRVLKFIYHFFDFEYKNILVFYKLKDIKLSNLLD